MQSWVEDNYNLELLRRLACWKETIREASQQKRAERIKCPFCRKNATVLNGGRLGLHWLVAVGHFPCRASYRRPDELNQPWDTVKWLGYYGYILLKERTVQVLEIPSNRSGYGGKWITLENAKELICKRSVHRRSSSRA